MYVLPIDTIFPAVFIKTLIAQALQEEGYSIVGDLLMDDLYKRLILPFTESEPTSYDEQWQADRHARITQDRPMDTIDKGTLGSGSFLDRIQPFNLDDRPNDGFDQGKLHPYNTTTYTYVCPSAMNLQVQVTQIFKGLCVLGGIELILSVEKNGNEVASNRWEEGAGYNILFMRTYRLELNQTIKCKVGDRIQIRLRAGRFTDIGAYRFEVYNDPDNSFVNFNPKIETATGDQWLVSRNLPDISLTTLMVNLARIFCGTWLVNRKKKQVSFAKLSDIVANTDNALDWSSRLDTSIEPTWTPRLEPYAQNNLLKWKETDQTKAAGTVRGSTILNYGDGILNINAPVLDAETDLFELAFAASTNSEQSIGNYGSPVLIKTRTTSGRGENLTINNQAALPRLLLVSLDKTVAVQSNVLLDDGVTIEPVTLTLKACWFGKRADLFLTEDTRYCLSFGQLTIGRGEECLLQRYYGGLQRVIRRMRVLTVAMRLKSTDIANLDFSRPIRLQRVQLGSSITLSDGYYYLNKISDYESGRVCSVTLVAF